MLRYNYVSYCNIKIQPCILTLPFLLSSLPASLDREDMAASKRAILIVEFLGEQPRGDGENPPPSRSDSVLPIPIQGIWNPVFSQLSLSLSLDMAFQLLRRYTCCAPTHMFRSGGRGTPDRLTRWRCISPLLQLSISAFAKTWFHMFSLISTWRTFQLFDRQAFSSALRSSRLYRSLSAWG